MELLFLSDQALLSETERLAQEERGLLTALLHHLLEIERRRLFSVLGYGSVFSYAVGRLAFSEDQAYRRVSSMRVLRDFPEIEEKIASGALSLTNISMARVAFRRLDAQRVLKLEILRKLENKTSKEAERILAGYLPSDRVDQVRATSEDMVEFRFSGPRKILKKLEMLKGLLAHKHPEISLGELFNLICDLALDALRPASPRAAARNSKAEVRRRVWARAEGKCQLCGSTYALEIDHIIPKAKGGTDAEENLRLLCRACNQRAAIEQFGQEKMDKFL